MSEIEPAMAFVLGVVATVVSYSLGFIIRKAWNDAVESKARELAIERRAYEWESQKTK